MTVGPLYSDAAAAAAFASIGGEMVGSQEVQLLKQIFVVLGSSGGGSSAAAIFTAEKQYTTPSTDAPITADGTVFTLAAGEKGFIQNLDDAAVYVKLGASASSTSFQYVLKAGVAANDGNGGSLVIDDYVGVVSIAAATGSPRVSAFKLS